ncbi:MAG: hypothetical protein KDB27_05110, partial [Planctomycetales bacterium]|nr:hypothetical protein [Planctomycetales bacterium]
LCWLALSAAWACAMWLWMMHVLNLQSLVGTSVDNRESGTQLFVRTIGLSSLSLPGILIGTILLIRGLQKDKPGNEDRQFTVRLLLVITLYVALFFSLLRFSWPVAVFTAGTVPAISISILFAMDVFSGTRRARFSSFLLLISTWLAAYVVSAGPAYLLLYLFVSRRSTITIHDRLYAPIDFVLTRAPWLVPWFRAYINEWW